MYKVLRRENGSLWSINNTHKQEYKEGVANKPLLDNSKIFVFLKYDDACKFFNSLNHRKGIFEIWECSGPHVGEVEPLSNLAEADKFWKDRKNHKKTSQFARSDYDGMTSVSELTLIRQVKF